MKKSIKIIQIGGWIYLTLGLFLIITTNTSPLVLWGYINTFAGFFVIIISYIAIKWKLAIIAAAIISMFNISVLIGAGLFAGDNSDILLINMSQIIGVIGASTSLLGLSFFIKSNKLKIIISIPIASIIPTFFGFQYFLVDV